MYGFILNTVIASPGMDKDGRAIANLSMSSCAVENRHLHRPGQAEMDVENRGAPTCIGNYESGRRSRGSRTIKLGRNDKRAVGGSAERRSLAPDKSCSRQRN